MDGTWSDDGFVRGSVRKTSCPEDDSDEWFYEGGYIGGVGGGHPYGHGKLTRRIDGTLKTVFDGTWDCTGPETGQYLDTSITNVFRFSWERGWGLAAQGTNFGREFVKFDFSIYI